MDGEYFDENTNTGETIYTLVAVDPDAGDTVTFYIKQSFTRDDGFEDGYDWFYVEPSNGNVSFKQKPNYESSNKFQITWNLDDGTNTVTYGNIKVYLNDLNDNYPVFNELIYTFNLFENSTNGHVVDVVHATDIDSEDNGVITYSLTQDSQVFEMQSNGTLIVKDSDMLDYENEVIYTLMANATTIHL
ncbi:cadherin-related family member 2-like [Antedon mediterranea]|uniref:cadherin-related family member 2-like n=1 Tax=Antedon mediterranea TaxID=105859 RepID=UPI003AF66DFC